MASVALRQLRCGFDVVNRNSVALQAKKHVAETVVAHQRPCAAPRRTTPRRLHTAVMPQRSPHGMYESAVLLGNGHRWGWRLAKADPTPVLVLEQLRKQSRCGRPQIGDVGVEKRLGRRGDALLDVELFILL